jgi:hypothetical protein
VIYDKIKKRHENFVMDQRISCSEGIDYEETFAPVSRLKAIGSF